MCETEDSYSLQEIVMFFKTWLFVQAPVFTQELCAGMNLCKVCVHQKCILSACVCVTPAVSNSKGVRCKPSQN